MVKLANYDELTKKEKDKHPYQVLHPLYDRISRTLIAGPSGSGKTNLLMHIILEPMIYYEDLKIYTKTPQQDKFVALKKMMDDIAQKSKIPSFCEITDKAVPDPDTYEGDKYSLIVFDDMILSKKDFDNIVKHYVLGRHKKCSCIFLSQSYYQTKKDIRINCTTMHLFRVPGRRECRSICVDQGSITEDMYNKNTEGFDFLTVDKIGKKTYRNIDEELYI